MGCSEDPKDGNYEFFDKVLDYIDKADKAKIDHTSDDDYIGCNSFSQIWKSKLKTEENAKGICKQLINLYKSLSYINGKLHDNPDYKKESSFLNYWVNMKISPNRTNDKNCAHNFSDLMESHCQNIFSINVLSDLLYDIKDDELNKINILYSLYEKYSKLKTIIEGESKQNIQSLLPHSNECCTHYIEAKYICNGGNNNSAFCKELETFVSKYEKLYQKFEVKRSDFSDSLIKLTECPNNKTITTAVTGTVVGLIPLFGVLYKFTPMGQLFKSKIGILNKDISNNDEEIIKMSLMEQENEQLKFQKGTYNIKYQSV